MTVLAGPPAPTVVVTLSDVDHDPVLLTVATACGIWLDVNYSTNPPQGTPSPKCFGDPS